MEEAVEVKCVVPDPEGTEQTWLGRGASGISIRGPIDLVSDALSYLWMVNIVPGSWPVRYALSPQ